MHPDPTPASHLPALLSSQANLLHRTQSVLGLLREVVQESSAEYWYEQGKQANALHSWEAAVAASQECKARDPNHWRAVLQATTAFVQQRQYESAASALQESYYLPYLESSHWSAELSANEWHLLRTSFEECKSGTHNSFNIMIGLAIVYTNTQAANHALARQTLDEILMLFPYQVKQSSTWHILDGCLADYNDFDGAWNSFKRAIDISQNIAAVYYRVALAEHEWDWEDALYSYGLALTEYKKAAELNKYHKYANYKIAKFYHYQGFDYNKEKHTYDEALYHYNLAIEFTQYFDDAYLSRGEINLKLGNTTDAITDFSKVIEHDQNNLKALYERGATYLNTGRYDKAIVDFDYIIEKDKSHSTYYKLRGDAKSKAGDYIGAIEDFSSAIKIEPKNRLLYTRRGDLKRKLGDFKGAVEDSAKYQR